MTARNSQAVAPPHRTDRPATPQALGRGTILSVASGKGGVGKTWLTVSLANALAQEGRRVLVFDGDLGLANVDVQLGIAPASDLASVITGQMTLAEAVSGFQGGADQAGGFDVLAGRSGSGALSLLRRDELLDLAVGLKQIGQTYDHVLVDLSAGIDAAVTTLSGLSDAVLVVATDEPTSLTDAYAFIKVSMMRDRDSDLRIVINQAEGKGAGRRTYEALANACRNFLKVEPPLAGIVPRDSKVRDAIRRQAPILTTFPQAHAAKAIAGLCADLFAPL
ncbi:MAG: AAA family ATPase [Alphaproteobacteria bacterium]